MSRRNKIVRGGTSAGAVLSAGISRHAIDSDRTWVEVQRALSEQRDVARVEVCTCGHARGQHQADCARCYGCHCCSFMSDRSVA